MVASRTLLFTLHCKVYADAKENQAAFVVLKNSAKYLEKPLQISRLWRGTPRRKRLFRGLAVIVNANGPARHWRHQIAHHRADSRSGEGVAVGLPSDAASD
jgi:hypothetical protein